MSKNLVIFIIIFILGAALRIGYFAINPHNMDFNGDDEPWSKINIARQWASRAAFGNLCTAFGPLHTYIISTLWLISPTHYIILSRIVSLTLGILFIPLFFVLLKDMFSLRAAYFGAFLLALYPMHIHLSSVSLAEMPACFLLFAALYFLCRFIKNNKIYYLVISAAALNLSCMLRFEHWLFVFLFTLVLFSKRRFSWVVFIFFILSCVFPVIWLLFTYKVAGDPLDFVRVSALVNQTHMLKLSLYKRIFGFTAALYRTFSLPVFICCVAGFLVSLVSWVKGRGTKDNIFLWLFSAILFIYTIRSIQGAYNFGINRYAFLLGLLFLPFGGIALDAYFRKFNRLSFLLPVLFLCLIYSLKTFRQFSGRLKIPDSLLGVVYWAKSNIRDDEKLLLECGLYHPFIIINSGLEYYNNVVGYDEQKLIAYGSENLKEYLENTDYLLVHKTNGLFRDAADKLRLWDKGGVAFENDDWYVLCLTK